ncbi:hypothetical protein THMIRHAS_03400 [Thiosulfatimonas sediminis]|uniref:Transglutaminase-like domain-containing protein n=1 Tax=Thiosulfatimonas sediminis TaxID=2675054 RepID=A0A6F8PSF9_9GAMM|nr:transglutaminase-like cysteine peptidase [Thiosulfatimonas sediminis]BBP44967.1 hypothetical protein THMIRHAS_03400 [Thiosulfatimonas sediminis]
MQRHNYWTPLIIFIKLMMISFTAQASLAENKLNQIKQQAKQFEMIEQIRFVNAQVNQSAEFVSDQEQYGKQEFWSSITQFLAQGKGDCEEFAVTKYVLMKQLGFKTALAYWKKNAVAHLSTVVVAEGYLWNLDLGGDIYEVTQPHFERMAFFHLDGLGSITDFFKPLPIATIEGGKPIFKSKTTEFSKLIAKINRDERLPVMLASAN